MTVQPVGCTHYANMGVVCLMHYANRLTCDHDECINVVR